LTRTEDEESQQLPFIPFLAIATWIVLMFDTQVAQYLESLYG
jgi:prepilin signal peptidase PulO-like enzyme (type II secretory pathway)